MASDRQRHGITRVFLSRLMSEYGMLAVLLLLCLLFSVLTVRDQHPTGSAAAEALIGRFTERPKADLILIAVRPVQEDSLFASRLAEKLATVGYSAVEVLRGDPSTVRETLQHYHDTGQPVGCIAVTQAFAPIVQSIRSQISGLERVEILTPSSRRWPTFLLADNLRNVANQITVIAIVAIGMTMVIITGGIDLSVGSLIALSAVVTAWLISRLGGEGASTTMMILGASGGVLVCGLTGAFSGLMITRFRIPPFIATLAMMQVAAGVAYIISQGMPIYQIPDSFILLGRGVDPVFAIPYAVVLMFVLYALAHVVMSRTIFGRYVYAVGGNAEAARLAGIRVRLLLFTVYTVCGLLAGLGGVIMSSQLKSGAPTYGITYELYVIAAVVVGGTSLSGGEGRILGTLIGAFVIGVVQNGMNLTNVETYTQKVVLGLIILGAVLLDRLKQQRMQVRKE
jgi:ribose transport system permease protein